MKTMLIGAVVAAILGVGCVVPWWGQNSAWAASSTGPTVQAQATYHGFVILTVTGTGFSPMSPVTISVASSLVSFVVSGPSWSTDATGKISFGPDGIGAACHNGVVKGTATVTDGTGKTATDAWQTVCKPLRGQ